MSRDTPPSEASLLSQVRAGGDIIFLLFPHPLIPSSPHLLISSSLHLLIPSSPHPFISSNTDKMRANALVFYQIVKDISKQLRRTHYSYLILGLILFQGDTIRDNNFQ